MSSTEATHASEAADHAETTANNDSAHEDSAHEDSGRDAEHLIAAEAARRQARQDPLQG